MEGHGKSFFLGVSIDYHPDGDRLVTAGADGTARIWDSETGEELYVLDKHTAGLTSVTFSPDGRYLATSQASGKPFNVDTSPGPVRIWDAETGQIRFSFESGHGDSIWELAFSPDGRFLATASGDGTIRLWAMDFGAGSAERKATLAGRPIGVLRATFSPDGRTSATSTGSEVRPRIDSSTGAPNEIFGTK